MVTTNDLIFLHRGDDLSFYFTINRGTTTSPEYYTLDAGDYLLFSVCEANQPFEHGIIRKVFTSVDNVPGSNPKPVNIVLTSDDTIYLEPGTYYYSIKLCADNGVSVDTETVLSKKKFVILD